MINPPITCSGHTVAGDWMQWQMVHELPVKGGVTFQADGSSRLTSPHLTPPGLLLLLHKDLSDKSTADPLPQPDQLQQALVNAITASSRPRCPLRPLPAEYRPRDHHVTRQPQETSDLNAYHSRRSISLCRGSSSGIS